MPISTTVAKNLKYLTRLKLKSSKIGAYKTSRRFASTREECAKDYAPRCSKEVMEKKPCEKKGKDENSKKSKSMWLNPECCNDPCPDYFPRFDDLYYKISDKATRKYTRTWVECPELKIVPRKLCCFEKVDIPPIQRRKPAQRPKTACPPSDECTKAGSKSKCTKIVLPGCRAARDPPKCRKERNPTDCTKICAPYPSFSECQKPKTKPKRPIECECLHLATMCDVWALLRKKVSHG